MGKTALVLGGAENVFDDVKKALALFEPEAFFVINDAIPRWPQRIDYAVTLHPEFLRFKPPRWLDVRARAGLPPPGQVWANRNYLGQKKAQRRVFPEVDHTTEDLGGSSGLLAVKIAREHAGFDRIVLCGVPMEVRAGHFVRRQPWGSATSYRSNWKRHAPRFAPFLRSMSGWTKEFFGAPTTNWLAS